MSTSKRIFLIGCLLFSANAIASPASESSVKQLLSVMQTRKVMYRIQAQFRSLMNNELRQQLKGEKLSAKGKKIVESMENELNNALQEEISWKKEEPLYLRAYKKTFSEGEIKRMIVFFKSPAGQVFVEKMPLLTHNLTLDYEKHIAPSLMLKLQKIEKKYMAELISESK